MELHLPENPDHLGWSIANGCGSLAEITGLTEYADNNPNRYQLYTDVQGGQAVIDRQASALTFYT